MKLVIGIVVDRYRNFKGYQVFDTEKGESSQVDDLDFETIYNDEIRNKYIIFSEKGRALLNKDSIITYVSGDTAKGYSIKEGWHDYTGRLTNHNVAIVNPATLIVTELDEDEFFADGELTPPIVENTVVSRTCKEYQVCRELKLAGVQMLSDLNYYTFGRLVDTLYFADLPLDWCNNRFGSQLSSLNRYSVADGYSIVECRSLEGFRTESTVVQGSTFNMIYLLVNSEDTLVRIVTSYSKIEDILDTILSLDEDSNYPEYKGVYSIASNIHLKNPRCDIEWVGAAVNRKDGGMYLAAKVKELGKDYWLKLLSIGNYPEFFKWAIGFDEAEENENYFDDMLQGIEAIIRKTDDPTNMLSQVYQHPQLTLESQYNFAL